MIEWTDCSPFWSPQHYWSVWSCGSQLQQNQFGASPWSPKSYGCSHHSDYVGAPWWISIQFRLQFWEPSRNRWGSTTNYLTNSEPLFSRQDGLHTQLETVLEVAHRHPTVTIYFFSLSKCLLSYLIFSTYLIFRSATPRSLHIAMKSHSPDVYFILGYRVFVLFIF